MKQSTHDTLKSTGVFALKLTSILIILLLAVYLTLPHYSLESTSLKTDLMKELPNNKCIYSISLPPHDLYNGYVRSNCHVFESGREYRILIEKPY